MSEPNSKLFRDDPAAYYTELGAEMERERIDEILDGWQLTLCNCDVCKAVRKIRKAIKGEQK